MRFVRLRPALCSDLAIPRANRQGLPGCWFANYKLTYDGVANGTNVWQWDVGCTPGGYGTNCTWKGYLYNGGGWPYYKMQFGANAQFCVVLNSIGCFNHGMRTWVDDSGNDLGVASWW